MFKYGDIVWSKEDGIGLVVETKAHPKWPIMVIFKNRSSHFYEPNGKWFVNSESLDIRHATKEEIENEHHAAQ